ncbi:MAG: MBL fold metallo-hydrolase [Pseudomonadota bacterium]
MSEILPGLFHFESEEVAPRPPTFVAVRSGGNYVFGNGHGLSDDQLTTIGELGEVKAVLIGDRHHGKVPSPIAARFDVPLCCSQEEAKVMKRNKVNIDEVVPFERHDYANDLEVIPTPGHTPGALSYLWRSGRNRILFVGDTIVPVDDEWKVWVSARNSQTMRDTMTMLADTTFNYLVCGSFAAPEKLVKMTSPVKARMHADVEAALK